MALMARCLCVVNKLQILTHKREEGKREERNGQTKEGEGMKELLEKESLR